MFKNKIKKMIKEGRIPIGIVVSQIFSDSLPMLLSSSGYDFILIDKEHSCFTNEIISKLALQSLGSNLTPLVRIPFNDLKSVSPCLDGGLQGIMIPMAEDTDEIKKVVERIKYLPEGNRGISLPNANTRFLDYPINDVTENSNNETMLILQIETKKALDKMEEFTRIDGVDALEIGPWDLSFSLGIPGQFDNPIFLNAVRKMIEICKKNNRWSGIYANSIDLAKKYIDMGINILFYLNDIVLITDKPKRDLSILKKI